MRTEIAVCLHKLLYNPSKQDKNVSLEKYKDLNLEFIWGNHLINVWLDFNKKKVPWFLCDSSICLNTRCFILGNRLRFMFIKNTVYLLFSLTNQWLKNTLKIHNFFFFKSQMFLCKENNGENLVYLRKCK